MSTQHPIDSLNIINNAVLKYDVSSLYKDEDNICIYKRDKFGLRGPYDDVSEIDIVTVGGSTTDQRYITEGKTWQDILSKEFANINRTINIANAGIDGQTSYGHIRNFNEWFPLIENFKTKYYLFYVGFNDVNDMGNDFDRYPFQKSRGNQGTIRGDGITKVGHLCKMCDEESYTIKCPELKNHEELMKEHLERYEHNLTVLCEKVKESGANIIFVTQSAITSKRTEENKYKYGGSIIGLPGSSKYHGYEVNALDRAQILHILNIRTLEVCKKVNGLPIDLEKDLLWEKGDFYDNVHNTPRGARKIGKYLFEKLKDKFSK